MIPWLDRVDEIIVVDSNSTDGTVEVLTNRIAHPNLQVHQRPRGLYQAWNSGIAQVESKYTYVSTVGDSITATGIGHLLKVAETYAADVVVSSPKFINEDGSRPKNPPTFPIENLLIKLRIDKTIILRSMECFDFIVSSFPNAILGSSASNLYRTEVLKECPFPTSYGTAGDGAWGIAHGMNHRIAITPGIFSTFRIHEKSYSKKDYFVDDLNKRLLSLLKQVVKHWITGNYDKISQAEEKVMREVLDLLESSLISQRNLESSRRQLWPWALNPRAWNERLKRTRIRNKIQESTTSLRNGIGKKSL
jgi:glycosyltransferase involved in cell wall biosynthesis